MNFVDQESSPIQVAAAKLQLPLTVPYRLAFGEQRQFDVLLVAVRRDGKMGWGEATILPGYTDETFDSSWQAANEIVQRGKTTRDLKAAANHFLHDAPFTASAFLTALDWLNGHETLKRSGRFELLGTVNGKSTDLPKLEKEVEALLAQGFKTLKVKIGWDPEPDLHQVNSVRSIAAGRAKLRVDGNQGYRRDQAEYFLKKLDPADIELVEQPCASGDWDSAEAIAKVASVPLMLDESIYTLDDIDRAAKLKCANYIKLKLMKLGTLDTLEKGLRQIADRGMKAVLGNGVATDLGCWMEVCVGLSCVSTAGEMNGFLKTPVQLLKPALKYEQAHVILDGNQPDIDLSAVAKSTIEHTDTWSELTASVRP
jgi:L-alanine-DL-glutamate epimerase-like enolase superfamily enzyme